MAATAPMRDWVNAVFGLALTSAGPTQSPAALLAEFHAASNAWMAAMAKVDRQMAVLKSALLVSDDPDLEEIAEQRLDATLGDGPQKLGALLAQLANADEARLRAAAGKTLPALGAMQQSIEQNRKVDACEANPVRVPVSIRATLGPAIARLQQVLGSAAGART